MSEKMSNPGVFPVTREANDKGWSAYQYREAFRAARPPKLTYYAYDVIIHSRTEVEFIAYDMRDNLMGGLGDEIGRFKATVPANLTKDDVERAIISAAALRLAAERAADDRRLIQAYADELRTLVDAAALVSEPSQS